MNKITDELFSRFKENLEGVDGTCVRSSADELAQTLVRLFKEQGLSDTCLVETELLKEAGVADALREAGIEVYTDHIRLHGETAKGGITENAYGIAELGTMVQFGDEVDARLAGTMSESYFGIVKGSAIVPSYDDMFEMLGNLPELPNFVGFITGPSRTADIECVGTVGVHGPVRLTAIVVDDR